MIHFSPGIRLFLSGLILAAAAGSAFAQDAVRDLILQPDGKPKVTQELAADMIAPVKCDAHGNIYFRVSGRSGESLEPVVKVNAGGGSSTKFDPQIIVELPKDLISSEFAFDETGGINQVILARTFDVYLVHFSPSGAVDSKVRVNDVFRPRMLSVLPSGDIFMLAAPPGPGDPGANAAFFAERLDSSGKSKSEKYRMNLPGEFQAQLGTDGKLYVLMNSKVTVYTQEAEKLFEFQLTPPLAGMQIIDWRPHGDLLFVQWVSPRGSDNPDPGFIVAVEATSGRIKARYRLSDYAQGGLACVADDFFVLSTVEPEGRLSFLKARPGAKAK